MIVVVKYLQRLIPILQRDITWLFLVYLFTERKLPARDYIPDNSFM